MSDERCTNNGDSAADSTEGPLFLVSPFFRIANHAGPWAAELPGRYLNCLILMSGIGAHEDYNILNMGEERRTVNHPGESRGAAEMRRQVMLVR